MGTTTLNMGTTTLDNMGTTTLYSMGTTTLDKLGTTTLDKHELNNNDNNNNMWVSKDYAGKVKGGTLGKEKFVSNLLDNWKSVISY